MKGLAHPNTAHVIVQIMGGRTANNRDNLNLDPYVQHVDLEAVVPDPDRTRCR